MATKKTATKKANGPDNSVVEMAGYRRRAAYAWREYTQFADDGEEIEGDPLKVKVQVNLSLGEREDLSFAPETTFQDVFERIAPYIVDWNVEAPDAGTGEMVKVPPPAEAGPDVLRALDEIEAIWLMTAIKMGRAYGIRQDDEKKDSTPSEPTDEP